MKPTTFRSTNHLSLPFRALLFLVALSLSSTAFAQTWTGTVNTNWNVAGNWTAPAAVPIATGNVVIPNTTNKPVILAGTLAVAKSVWVKPGAMLTINVGSSLTINGSAGNAILNEGSITNNATLKIGATTGISGFGIYNTGSFTNQSGTITIDRTGLLGIGNDPGATFINKATITIGAAAGTSIGGHGISNYGSFTNETGTISINRTVIGAGISNVFNGTFTNKATITIGGVANIDGDGIINFGNTSGGNPVFTNQSGTINIDRIAGVGGGDGVQNVGGVFINKALIKIGATANINRFGVYNNNLFTNESGTISIDRTGAESIRNSGGTFTNKADIKIGSVASISLIGIQNLASFTNESGTITIDRVSNSGWCLYNGGIFTNKAAIKIGNVANAATGISNQAAFTNQSGTITIYQTGANQSGIENSGGAFTNKATILIGTSAAIPGFGIRNQAIFTNDLLGIIHINRTGQSGIHNQTGTFTNKATINIGNVAVNITGHGIANNSTFMNETGAINIDRTTTDGINNSGGTFTNKATISIGATANIGANGISNAASFTNESGGIIINRTTTNGIINVGGTFTNKAGIAMGTIALTSIGGKGIENSAVFTNQSGSIVIDRVSQGGIKNATGTFTNKASISIGLNAAITGIGVENLNVFLNDVGATMGIDRTSSHGISNPGGTFTNKAIITIGGVANTNIGNNGILNGASFTNETGTINIDRTTMDAVTNSASSTFTNKAILKIGGSANISGDGIRNSGTFTNETGTINIDRVAVFGKFGIENQAGIFTNKATINIGALAALSGHGIYNGAVFINQSGTIAIDRINQFGIVNQPTGTFTNFTAINIGGLASIAGTGIGNNGSFTNEISGNISIYRTLQYGNGINNGGTFINKAIVAIGGTGNIGDEGIYNAGIFTNQSGTISIDRTAQSAIFQQAGTFTNQATINIGGITATTIGLFGIRNHAIFNNDAGGTINIDRALAGIINQGGTFTNKASINLGNAATIAGDGILNAGTFTHETGIININRTGGQGILTQNTGIFTNKATIRIGNLAGIVGNGIQNEAGFTNELGSIDINRTGGSGIYNRFSGAFINKAVMTMGTVAGTNIGVHGIDNQAVFTNETGSISIDRTIAEGISNVVGTFTNKATINLGNAANIAGNGIFNVSTFTHETGLININRTGGHGIVNQTTGMFTNKAIIRIGNLAGIGASGIQNSANFTNELGSININRTAGPGIYNFNSGAFINKAIITMGTIAGTNIAIHGIDNHAAFTNETTGSINIDRTIIDGVNNLAGTFTNKASVKIGATASIGVNGISNHGINFTNESGAITIDRTGGKGILNLATFTNKSNITVGGSGPIGGDGLANSGGTFLNDVCAVLTLFDNLNNVSAFNNLGLFTLNTAQPHTNGILFNDGIIDYIQGNPIPNVTNNDIILEPISGCPNSSIQPALNIGGANSFTVGSTWYSNVLLTIPAGSYVQGTNTFTSTLGVGTYTLYMSINGVPSCPRTVSIQVKLVDNLSPVPVCMDPIIDLDTFCNPYTLLPIDVFVGGTDNCGVVNVISISPSMVTCADVGNTITVTVTVDDGNGNTATCTSNVGVIQFTSNPVNNRARPEEPLLLSTPSGSVQRVRVFPNPASSEVNIAIEKEYASGMLQLYDMQGRLAFTQLLEDTSLEYHLNVNDLAAGAYMLRVLLDKEHFVQPLIISERE
ncbi:MAG: T9SS type A sorting domain-containing protein [Phycisphaerae bacterium]|nr:T9SS type A sorting domain-containing protein [Saprospiraceae bacterium]